MAIRTKHTDKCNLYYMTFTCFNWLPLFHSTNAYDTVYNWFYYLQGKKQIKVTAYVIMPNHLHCILFFPNEGYSLNTIVSNAKRFMAYEIVKRLKATKQESVLQRLQLAVTAKEKAKGQKHKVFKESFDAKGIDNELFFWQKLNYIHLNPVIGKYHLVDDWREYEHSSAGFYELQHSTHFTPVHYLEL